MDLKQLARLTVTSDSLLSGLSPIAKAHLICDQLGIPQDLTKTQQILIDFDKACEEFQTARQAVEDARKAAIEKEVQAIADKILPLLDECLGIRLPDGKIVPWNSTITWSCLWQGVIQTSGGHNLVGSKHGEKIDLGKGSAFIDGAKELARMVYNKELTIDSKGSQMKLVQLFQQSRRGVGVTVSCGVWSSEQCPRFGDRRCHSIEFKVMERV